MLVLVLVALALAAAQIVLAMKMKEGHEWARLALTIVAGGFAAAGNHQFERSARARTGGTGWASWSALVATVLMWVPNSQAWFAAGRGRA